MLDHRRELAVRHPHHIDIPDVERVGERHYDEKLLSGEEDHCKPLGFRSALTADDYGEMLLCAFVMGAAVGQNGTALPHGMGYELSSLKGVSHGYDGCIFLEEYLRVFRDWERVSRPLSICGFESIDELEVFLGSLISANVSFSVTKEEIALWAGAFCRNRAAWSGTRSQ